MDIISSLFYDPCAEARAFYGNAFPAMLEWQNRLHESARKAERLTNDLVDDVACQTPDMGRQQITWALMR